MGAGVPRGFEEEASGNVETAVASDVAPQTGFDPGSEDHEAAPRHLPDSGYLSPAAVVGGDAYRITAAGPGRLTEG